MILQIGTALAIGAYVVLSKDAQPKRPDATPRKSLQQPADHLDRDGRPERLAIHSLAHSCRRMLHPVARTTAT